MPASAALSTTSPPLRGGWLSARAFAWLLLFVGVSAQAALLASPAPPAAGEQAGLDTSRPEPEWLGFTTPLQRSTLASPQTGRIAAVRVDFGTRVKAGDVLVQLEDNVQRARAAIADALAQSELEIQLAETRLEQTRVELARLEGLQQSSAATAKELLDARSEAKAAELELSLAQFRHEQAARDAALQRAALEEFQIRAPFDGFVAEKLCEVGETVEPGDGILTVVRVDSLDVVVDCPIEQAQALREGRVALVSCAARPGDLREGRIMFISRLADAASQTTKVRVRLENPGLEWPAGAAVSVRFSAHSAGEDPIGTASDGPNPQAHAARPGGSDSGVVRKEDRP